MRKIFTLISLLGLTGCGSLLMSGVPGLAEVEILTVMATEKSIIDHVVSLSSGKNCSYVEVEKGGYYCEEDEPKIAQNIYCYNTLGSVTCYTKEDPHQGRYQKIGENDHNLVDPKSKRSR